MKKRAIASILCVSLCVSMVACGKSEKESAVSVNETKNVESAGPMAESVESDVEVNTDETKEMAWNLSLDHVDDFSYQVNEDWYQEMGIDVTDPETMKDFSMKARTDDAADVVDERMYMLFEEGSLACLGETDPLYKLNTFYGQVKEQTTKGGPADERICEIIDEVESIESIDGLYAWMLQEDYVMFDHLLDVRYEPVFEDCFAIRFVQKPFLEMYSKSGAEQEMTAEGFAKALQALNYDEEIATRMAENAIELDYMIQKFYFTSRSSWEAYTEDKYAELDIDLPLMDIIKTQDFVLVNYEHRGEKEYVFLMEPDYIDLLNDFFVMDNLQMLKDYFAVCVLEELIYYTNPEAALAYYNIDNHYYGIDEASELSEYDVLYTVESIDKGVLANYYVENYVDDTKVALVEDMFESLQIQMLEMVKGIDWLSEKTKEQYRFKIKNMKLLLGSYEYYNRYEDVEICDNVVDTALSFKRSNWNFRKRLLDRKERYSDTRSNLLSYNAWYLPNENMIAVENGFFESDYWDESVDYEKQVGMLGSVLAHEMGHGFDSDCYYYDLNGKWTEFISGEEDDAYGEHFTGIYDAYMDKTTLMGNTCDCYLSADENFADHISVAVCLKLLEQMDNPSYEEFFITYAISYGDVYSPGCEKIILREDTHLPGHERVNITLAQFDRFYETFTVDESSAYFVPSEERYQFFK